MFGSDNPIFALSLEIQSIFLVIRLLGILIFNPIGKFLSIKKVKKSAIVSSIVSKSNNKSLFVFDEEKLDEKNISDLLKKNPNKMITFVLSNIIENKLIIKFQNYKKIYFLSDKSYSVHTALKSDMLLFSKKSTIYNSYIGNN